MLAHGSDISGGFGPSGAKVPEPQPKCPVCGVTVISGDIVMFEQGELVHLDCHWDPSVPRRPLARAMFWPR
jgi:hypothetical protein